MSEGWGASSPGWFILPSAQDLGQTVSSVNSYCTIILEYLVVRDINIISVKLKCLHPMFSLVMLVQGLEGKLSRLVYLAPRPGFGSGSVTNQFLLHHTLEYLVVRDINIISVKLRCLHPTFSLVSLVRGVGGKLSRLVYLVPRPGFESGIVISQFLLHHNHGKFSCKSCEHYFIQTEMFTSDIQFSYPCPRGGGQAVQAGLLKFWAGGQDKPPGQLAPHPLSIHNRTEHLK